MDAQLTEKYTHPEVWNPGETDAVDLLIVALKYRLTFGGIGKYSESNLENMIIKESDERGRQ